MAADPPTTSPSPNLGRTALQGLGVGALLGLAWAPAIAAGIATPYDVLIIALFAIGLLGGALVAVAVPELVLRRRMAFPLSVATGTSTRSTSRMRGTLSGTACSE